MKKIISCVVVICMMMGFVAFAKQDVFANNDDEKIIVTFMINDGVNPREVEPSGFILIPTIDPANGIIHVGWKNEAGEFVDFTQPITQSMTVYAVFEECTHVWETEYTIDKEATRYEDGQKSIHCEVCNMSDPSTIESIPKIVIPLEKIVLNYEYAVLQMEEKFDLRATYEPLDTTDDITLTYASSDESVATVDKYGRVVAINEGVAIITVSVPSGKSAECYVYVYAGPYDNLKQIKRIYGKNRYETSFKIANELMNQLKVDIFNGAIIANGENFADALAGSYLSSKYNAPILMTNNKNHNEVMMYLLGKSASRTRTYLLGGTSAVCKPFDASLRGFEYDYKRLAGNNRYDTNLEILNEANVTTEPVLVCTGNGFADSLSASATGYPILLVNKTLTTKQKTFLNQLNGNPIIIIGGTSAVSSSIEQQLKAYGTVERLAGDNRYQTSVMVAEKFFDKPNYAVLAYARNFPDGLSGGPLAYYHKAPLILTDNNNWQVASEYIQEMGIVSGAVLGGPTLISSDTVKNIFNVEPNTMDTCSKKEKYLEFDYDIVSNGKMVLASTIKSTTYYKDANDYFTYDKELKRLKEQLKGVRGVEYSYDQMGGYVYEELSVDYELVDFQVLINVGLMDYVNGQVPDYVDYQATIDALKEEGCNCKLTY